MSTIGASLLGCHVDSDPRSAYDRVELNIRHGDLIDARTEVDQALARYGRAGPEWQWRFRILKAQILDSQSDYVGALACLAGSLPTSLADSEIAVRKSIYEGVAYRIGKDFDKSRRSFAAAEVLAAESYPQLLSKVLTARGALEIEEANYDAANASYGRALLLVREQQDQDQEAALLLDIGRLDTIRQRFDEAIDQDEAALRLSRSLGKQSFVATILGNLGWAYSELGDLETALEYFKESAAESERIGMTGNMVYWFTGIANTLLALHDYPAAETSAKQTLERARRIDNKQTITVCLNTLSQVALVTGRLGEAERYNQEALKLEESVQDPFGVVDATLLSGRIEAKKGHFIEAEKLFRRVIDDPGAQPVVRWEVRARLAELDDARGLPAQAEKEYRQSIQTFETVRASIESDALRLSFLSAAIEFYDGYVDFLIRHRRPDDALRVAELSRGQTLEEGLAGGKAADDVLNRSVQPQQLAQHLKATVLFYWLGETHSYLWVITPLKTTCLPLPAASEIDPAVKSYREGVAESKDVAETEQAAGEKLYATLVAPAQSLISPDSRVILLPDGSLYSLNFETLIVPAPKPHFWIEDVTITTAGSLSLLAAGASRPLPKQKNLLLVGDALKAANEFNTLPQAEGEMQMVERYFPDPNRMVLKGGQATPSAYLSSNPERYAYLHFVTHGTASLTRPLESAVILSKDPSTDSYKLYARDIVTRHLNAELVTISACNGAGSRAFSGEGLVGLSWAFLRAGAHNVIGALWEVSDSSTPRLMDTLYGGLSRGQDPASALRAAKLSLLHSDNAFKKPYYWAPFQLYAGS